MPLPSGKMTVDFLADGEIKVETGDMGGVDHKSADQFMADLARFMGGSVAESKVAHGFTHTHTHADGETHTHQ